MTVWGKKERKNIDGRTLNPIGNKIGVGNDLPTFKELQELRNGFKEASTALTESDVTSENVLKNLQYAGELNGYNKKLIMYTKARQLVRKNTTAVMSTALQEYQAMYRDTGAFEQNVSRAAQNIAPEILKIDGTRVDHEGFQIHWKPEYEVLLDW